MRRAASLLGLGGVLGATGGLLLIGAGLHSGQPDAAPLPAHTFTASGLPGESEDAAQPGRETVRLAASRVAIPSLSVDAPIEDTRVRGGELVIPGDPRTLARWEGGASLDAEAGTTLLAGHVDINGDLGALHKLASVTPGAIIHTADETGKVTTWAVSSLEVRRKNDLPDFSKSGQRRLVLVTCGGPAERVDGYWSYRDNVIVTATPL